MPSLREECQESSECKGYTHHFLACQERVQEGKGYKGEDCVEELYVILFILHSPILMFNFQVYVLSIFMSLNLSILTGCLLFALHDVSSPVSY
jgi:hypothetical protein